LAIKPALLGIGIDPNTNRSPEAKTRLTFVVNGSGEVEKFVMDGVTFARGATAKVSAGPE